MSAEVEASPVTGIVIVSVAVPSLSLEIRKSKLMSSAGQNSPDRRADFTAPAIVTVLVEALKLRTEVTVVIETVTTWIEGLTIGGSSSDHVASF